MRYYHNFIPRDLIIDDIQAIGGTLNIINAYTAITSNVNMSNKSLFVYLNNGDIVQIDRICAGFRKVEKYITNKLKFPLYWISEWNNINESEKEEILENFNKNSIALNSDIHRIPFDLEDQLVFFKVRAIAEIGRVLSTRDMNVIRMFYSVYKIDRLEAKSIDSMEKLYLTIIRNCCDSGVKYDTFGILYHYCRPVFQETLDFINETEHDDIIRFLQILEILKDDDKRVFVYKVVKNIYDTEFLRNIWLEKSKLRRSCMVNSEKIYKKIYDKFIYKFGRAPKIIDKIVECVECGIVDADKILDNFKPKKVAKLLNDYSIYATIRILDNPELEGLQDFVFSYPKILDDKQFIYWIRKHNKTNEKNIMEIYKNYDAVAVYYAIHNDASLKEVMSIIEKIKAAKECRKISQKYKGFDVAKLVCNIKKTTVNIRGQRAYVLNANDPKQVMLGYYTCCCQHLEGAGESAMMYGLLSSNGGFWAIEEKSQIVAQAEIWTGLLDGKEVLVFDNIELANDRDFNLVRKTLEKWLESSSYKNIIMGTGFNVLTHGYDAVVGKLVQPVCMALNEEPYTDADTCVWLKKEGEVQYV